MVHQVEENLVFALEMVIQPALAELQSGRNIIHGSGVVSTLLEEAGGGAQDFLP